MVYRKSVSIASSYLLLLSINLRVVADTETDSKQHVKYTNDDGDFHLVSIQEANFVFSNLKIIKFIWIKKIFGCLFWFYYLMFSLHNSTSFVPIGRTTPCTTEVNPEEMFRNLTRIDFILHANPRYFQKEIYLIVLVTTGWLLGFREIFINQSILFSFQIQGWFLLSQRQRTVRSCAFFKLFLLLKSM